MPTAIDIFLKGEGSGCLKNQVVTCGTEKSGKRLFKKGDLWRFSDKITSNGVKSSLQEYSIRLLNSSEYRSSWSNAF